MGGQHTALGAGSRCQEEVELVVLVVWLLLYKGTVDDAAGGWVMLFTVLAHHKEALTDSLVDDDNSDLRLLGSLVRDVVDGSLELGNLVLENLQALSITNTVTVDHVAVREVSIVVHREGLDSFLQVALHLILHDLLALLLHDEVAVVLTHLLVDRGRESNYRLGASVADVDTDKHGSLLLDDLWELQVVEISTSLGVNLSQDI